MISSGIRIGVRSGIGSGVPLIRSQLPKGFIYAFDCNNRFRKGPDNIVDLAAQLYDEDGTLLPANTLRNDGDGVQFEPSCTNKLASGAESLDTWSTYGFTATDDSFVCDTGTAVRYAVPGVFETASGVKYCCYADLTYQGFEWVRVGFGSSGFPDSGRSVWFNMLDGVIGTQQSGTESATIQNSDGSYRCIIFATADDSVTNAQGTVIVPSDSDGGTNSTGDGIKAIGVKNFQVTTGYYHAGRIPCGATQPSTAGSIDNGMRVSLLEYEDGVLVAKQQALRRLFDGSTDPYNEQFDDTLINLLGSTPPTKVSEGVYDVYYTGVTGTSHLTQDLTTADSGAMIRFSYEVLADTTGGGTLYLSSSSYSTESVVLDTTIGTHAVTVPSDGTLLWRILNYLDASSGYIRIRVISIQQLTPQPMTVITTIKVGADLEVGDTVNLLSTNEDETCPLFYGRDATGTYIAASDGTSTATAYVDFARDDVVVAKIQTSEDVSTFKASGLNLSELETTFTDSSDVTYAGSIPCGDLMIVADGVTIPGKGQQIYCINTVMSDADAYKLGARYAIL
jgi:hypothetical protein